jgi:hypothetical protein
MVGALPYHLLDTRDGSIRKLPELGLGSWAWTFVRGGAAVAHIPSSDVVTVFDLESCSERTWKVENGSARGMTADQRGEQIYLSIGAPNFEQRSEVRLVGAHDFSPRETLDRAPAYLGRLALSGDGCRLVAYAGSDYNASLRDPKPSFHVWNIPGSKRPKRAMTRIVPNQLVNGFALSFDGSRLATAGSSALSLWDTATGERVMHSGQHRRAVTAVACSPTQPSLVSGDGAGRVFLWDTTGRVLKQYDWGLGEVVSVAFAPDGLRVAAVGASGKVVIWDVDA